MLKDFLSRLTQSRLWQQARTLWRVATGAGATRKNEGLDLFLAGHSIGRVSALLLPGVGGPALVARQLEIQADIREYTLAREKEVLELKKEVGELRAALNDLVKQAKPEPAEPGQLLGELLGVA